MKHTTVICLILCALVLTGCGRKGPLVPPEALVPAAVETLAVRQQGWDLLVTWSAPSKEQGGRPLRDLAGFRLLRHQLIPGETDCAACADAWQLLADVDLDLPRNVRQSGGLYLYRDATVKPGSANQYRLIARSRSGGVSRPATSPVKKVLPVPAPPTLKAALSLTGIGLELAPPTASLPGFAGFNIYRRPAGGETALLPLNRTPVTGPAWEDRQVEYGATYRYGATTLVRIEGELVESLPCTEAEVLFTQPEIR